jgi:hypothetical protein
MILLTISALCAGAQTAILLSSRLVAAVALDKRGVRSDRCLGAVLTKESEVMLWTILVILLILWLLGFLGNFGGNLIHILIVVAVIILIYNLVSGRRSV